MSKNLVLISPTYGPILPEVSNSLLAAVMHAASRGVTWWGLGGTDRESWSAARSMPVDALREYGKDVDGAIWADSDMLFPLDAFARLPSYGHDLVSGIYFQRRPPFWPVLYKWSDKKKGFQNVLQWPDNVIAPIGGFGFGCCYTSMKLLKAMPPHPFEFGEFSEDLGFCHEATKRGFTPYVDTGIQCEHYLGPRWSNRKLFEKFRAVTGAQIFPDDQRILQFERLGIPVKSLEMAGEG